MNRPKWLPDNFSLMLMGIVVLATLLPISGKSAVVFSYLTDLAIGLLFFLHGVKLSREAVIEGITHWRLHLTIFMATFVLYPLMGLALQPILSPFMPHELCLGFLYLCFLPSTVQSSIAFVSMAKGNVSAAVCSASASNIIGMFLTPLLVAIFITHSSADTSAGGLDTVGKIVLLLLVPFILGQICRNKLIGFVKKNADIVKIVDQGSILMVVYSAFSAAIIGGIWQQVSWAMLLMILLVCLALLALIMIVLYVGSKKLGFNQADQLTILFCGSKKTLASGVPMAKIIFAGQPFGPIILPLMLFHQLQLLVCGVIASYFAKK